MHPRSRRLGFTLVELLVVIAIIGTLMGLLLPAVQNAREAGRRNTCSNNLRQLAIGVTAYDGAKGRLPGWSNPHPYQAIAPNVAQTLAPVNWAVILLPNLERNDVFDQWQDPKPKAFTIQANNGNLPQPHLPILTCPTSPPDSADSPTLAYAVNAGTTIVNTSGRQFIADGAVCNRVGGQAANSTQNFVKAQMNLDMITGKDGTTTTLLFGEKNGINAIQGFWSNSVSSVRNDFNASQAVYLLGAEDAWGANSVFGFNDTITHGGLPINAGDARVYPSSNHPGGAIFAFCDGHQRFISESVTGRVYGQLLSSDTGNASAAMAKLCTKDGQNAYFLSEGDIP